MDYPWVILKLSSDFVFLYLKPVENGKRVGREWVVGSL